MITRSTVKTIITIWTCAVVLAAAGCENPAVAIALDSANRSAEASGLPFRWKSERVDGGTALTRVMIDTPSGPTRADPALKADTLKLIGKAEAKAGRGAPKIEEIKPLQDGRGVNPMGSIRWGQSDGVRF